MDNYTYNSYAESGESTPRSRDVDFDHTQPWEDQSATNNNNYKVKFMCSYGGKIHPRPHDNQLSYVGGETKILAVDRLVKFNVVIAKLATLCDGDVFFKYQLPGEDLDALISVTNDDDLEHMMHEFDRLSRASATPARLRLFLFPVSFGSTDQGRTDRDRDRFMDAVNTGHVQPTIPIAAQQPHGNNEHMFHPHNEMMHQPQINHQVMDAQDQKIAVISDCATEANRLQKHIEDLQRLQIAEEQQPQQQPLPPGLYRKPSDDNLAACYTENNYAQKMMEKVAPTTGYQISPEQQQQQQQPMYMIQTPASMYHASVARPSHGQGYYVQRMPHDVYRDQQTFNMPPLGAPQAVATQQTTVSSQQQFLPQNVATYTEGYQMVQSTTAVTDQGYGQVAYDNMTGRQVYYTTQGAVLAQQQQQLQPSVQQYQTMAVAAAATVTISQDNNGAKVVAANMKEFI